MDSCEGCNLMTIITLKRGDAGSLTANGTENGKGEPSSNSYWVGLVWYLWR